MLKSIVLIGPPFSGKSTLMRGLRARLVGVPHSQQHGLLCFEWWPRGDVLLIGHWFDDDDPTPGCDRLAPEAAAWLRLLVLHQRHLGLEDAVLVIAGHKLLSPQLMTTLRNQTEHTMIRLVASDAIRAERLTQRPGGPMEAGYAWALSVRYAWLSATYEPDAVWPSETEADYERNLARLCALVGIDAEVAA